MKKLLSIIILFFCISFYFGILNPEKTKAVVNFTDAYAELTNPRFSYRGGVNTGILNTRNIKIDITSNSNTNGDIDTHHLYPDDRVCFTSPSIIGCKNNKYYTVNNIIDEDEFGLTENLQSTLNETDLVIASQSGQVKFNFTTVTEIPVGGSIFLTIPANTTSSGKADDTFPDTGSATNKNGFDLNGIIKTDITITGCTDENWNLSNMIITPGNGTTTNHTISIPRVLSPCRAFSKIAVTIDSDPGLLNPALVAGVTHNQGVGNVYTFNIKSRDANGNTFDESDIKIVPIEGLLISAIVGETYSEIPRLTLFGYGPKKSQVDLTCTGVSRATISTDTGYFEFMGVSFPKPILSDDGYYYPEICLQGFDTGLNATTQPTCIPPLKAGEEHYYVGPVILSPTLVVEKGTLTQGEQIKAYGTTVPGTDVNVFLAKEKTSGGIFKIIKNALAYYIPSYQIKADSSGYYEFNIPADSHDTWKVTTGGTIGNSNSPLSNSLTYEVIPNYYIFVWNVLILFSPLAKYPFNVVILLILLMAFVLFKYRQELTHKYFNNRKH